MLIKARKNPHTCNELAVYLGYPVNSWTQHPDGSYEIDLGVDTLTDAQKRELRLRLLALPNHWAFEGL